VANDFAAHNVALDHVRSNSLSNLYRRLLMVRRTHPALTAGAYAPVTVAGNVLAYERVWGVFRVLVVLNMGEIAVEIPLPAGATSGTVLVSTDSCRDGLELSGPVVLNGHDGVIVELHA
jgi:glycosidase